MKNLSSTIKLRQVSLACLMACGVAASMASLEAIAASGKFTYVTGPVFIETNGKRTLAVNGAEVNPGDIIIAEADGMAQLAMIDQAKLSLRSNSRLRIDSYQKKVGDQDGAVLSLLRGTLRTFTGLLTTANREKYQMKTRVATVGIRGSGNILSHEEDDNGANAVSINHTIEGSHIVSSIDGKFSPIFTFPNDTVKVVFGKPPEKIPTPPSITAASNTMVSKPAQKAAADITTLTPPTTIATGNPQSSTGTGGGNNGGTGSPGSSGVTTPSIVPPVVAIPDPTGLRDIVLAGSNATYSGQAAPAGTTLEGQNLRGFTSASGGFGAAATITGGTIADATTVSIGNGTNITFGRWNAPTNVNFAGLGSFSGPAATTHFAYANAGYPAYLSDVLTGTVVYTRVGATLPTDESGTTGSITSTLLNVNFTQRLLNATIALAMPVAGSTPATNYTLQATNVPFTLNSFFAIVGYGLTVTNNTTGQNSNSNFRINGSLEGSFVGAALNGAILGYSLQDASTNAVRNIGGVIAFQGPAQNTSAPYRYGLISDPTSSLARSQYTQTYATINRPDEMQIDAAGRASAFRGPYARSDGSIDGNQRYAQGTSQVVDNGIDATTGISWGRWSGGSATIGGTDTSLASRSQHYIFSATQTGPTTLPLTGTAVYEVAGATRPTDLQGNVGTFNSATLNANFSARTADATVNVTIANQTWNASASGMPIYRDVTFAANTGRSPGGGLPAPTQLNITCTPNCGAGATGSFDGFFTGTTGQGAGLMYNLNRNIAGAVAFRRRQ
jgi:regulator of RNase E activity RraA